MNFGLACFTLVLMAGCNPTKISPLNYEKQSILFGRGGGFTGIETTYKLLDNGQLFELKAMRSEAVKIKNISKQQTKQIFNNISMLGLDTKVLNEPDNMYHFIEVSHGDQTNRIVWGRAAEDNIKVFYQILMHLLK